VAYELSKQGRERARRSFEEALENSAPGYELGQLQLFAEEDERFIKREVERKLHDPGLPNGGNRERRIIERLKKLAKEEWEGKRHAWLAIQSWEKVLPADPRNPGRYYARRALSRRDDKDTWEWAIGLKERSNAEKNWEKKWFAQMILDGVPEAVSDFKIECLFLLRNTRGAVMRLVQLKNIRGETSLGEHHGGSVLLDEDAFGAPEKFRKWCLRWGNFAWAGNQKDLHKLHEDMNVITAWMVINQIEVVGWHELKGNRKERKGIWFFEDCAYVNGKALEPDDDGVFWWEGEGYYPSAKGRENEFAQGKPLLRPKMTVARREDESWDWSERTGSGDVAAEKAFFVEAGQKFFDTLGGYEGWLAMGAIFAYAAAPELFGENGFFPGLFVHGQMGSGKTNFTEWLMAMVGFGKRENVGLGIGLLKGSAVGLLIQNENYSNLPLWVDEFREGQVHDDKVAILRDAHNRVPPEKWSPDGVQRKMRTSFLVSGESTSSDAAMRSRYPHVQVAASKRLGNHLDWMNKHKDFFAVFWRLLMERRSEFVTALKRNLAEWIEAPGLTGMNEREKRVYGIDWAAFEAMNGLMGSAFDTKQMGGFLNFMVATAKSSSADVVSETNINVFFSELLTAFKAGAIPEACFKTMSEHKPHPPGAPEQAGGWREYKLYMDPDSTISALQIYLTKGRSTVPLRRKDLRDQLSKNAYWIAGKLRQRFGDGDEVTACWGFDLDKHPLGYQPVPQKDYEYLLLHPGEGDPRKGPLFAIVNAVEKRERESEESVR
jgi:hypothetical protein